MNPLYGAAANKRNTDIVSARFKRKAHGRIPACEARRLGRLYGVDLHWKYLRVQGDKLALRTPGNVAERVAEVRKYTPQAEARATHWRERTRDLFWWYGPRFTEWPGAWPAHVRGATFAA